jgi:hypothetical protein
MGSVPGETCESRDHLQWTQDLQTRGFEIAYHNGAPGTLRRPDIIRSLDLFREYFGHDPVTMANHYNEDAMYWGNARLSGITRAIYVAATRGRNGWSYGHVDQHPSFWGDVCRDRIRYCRNFVFREINTLHACPFMPYSDPDRPYVANWFASSEGSNYPAFVRQISERKQDELEEQGGACIMYTHFGHGYFDTSGALSPEFKRLMKRLSQKRGWFVPVNILLDYLAGRRCNAAILQADRDRLERRWLAAKLLHGTS